MSSHHIIREDQEPALLIADASAGNFESLQQLLEWSPTVLVTAPVIEHTLLLGIKIDVAIVPEADVEKWRSALYEQAPVRILTATSENDLLETALYFLAASKQRAVNIFTHAAFEAFEKFSSLDVAVIREGRRWVFIRSGRFEKWLPAGTEVHLYPELAHPEPVVDQEGMVTVHRDHSFWVCEIN